MILYYNPSCSKCREAKELLDANACAIEIREYLKDPPTKTELNELLKKLGCKAVDLVRASEPIFIEKYKGKKLSRTQWIAAMVKYPILIERPILIDDEKAIVGRPPRMVLELK